MGLIPSGNFFYIAMENGPVEIVDLPIKHGDFPWSIVMLVYQRVSKQMAIKLMDNDELIFKKMMVNKIKIGNGDNIWQCFAWKKTCTFG